MDEGGGEEKRPPGEAEPRRARRERAPGRERLRRSRRSPHPPAPLKTSTVLVVGLVLVAGLAGVAVRFGFMGAVIGFGIAFAAIVLFSVATGRGRTVSPGSSEFDEDLPGDWDGHGPDHDFD